MPCAVLVRGLMQATSLASIAVLVKWYLREMLRRWRVLGGKLSARLRRRAGLRRNSEAAYGEMFFQ